MSEDAECPTHEHVWSLLISADGGRQCLVDGCYAVREPDGVVRNEDPAERSESR